MGPDRDAEPEHQDGSKPQGCRREQTAQGEGGFRLGLVGTGGQVSAEVRDRVVGRAVRRPSSSLTVQANANTRPRRTVQRRTALMTPFYRPEANQFPEGLKGCHGAHVNVL